MRLVAPFGFYGSGNIGDEATLLGFGRLIERFGGSIGVDVASSDPAHTKRVEPAFRYYQYVDGIMGLPAKLHAHMGAGYIIPGGTPLMDNLGDWPLLTDAQRQEGVARLVAGAGQDQKGQDYTEKSHDSLAFVSCHMGRLCGAITARFGKTVPPLERRDPQCVSQRSADAFPSGP